MKKNLLIAATRKKNSTFIQAHYEKLPGNNLLIYGASLPIYKDDGTPFFFANPIINKIEGLLERLGLPGFYFRKKAIKKYLTENKIHAVLAEFAITGVQMMDLCQELNIPMIVTVLGYDGSSHWALQKYGPRYKEFSYKAAAVVCVSTDLMKTMKDLGVPEKILHFIPCGPNYEAYQLVQPHRNPPHFLAVAAFTEKKGYPFTLKAFHRVTQEIPEAKLHIVGDGKLFGEIKEMRSRLGLGEKVIFHGRKNLKEIMQISIKSRAFVQHSITAKNGDTEGTPVAILEAASIGLPIVSTKHGGINDAVIHDSTGFLVKEKDINGMASYMIELAKNREKAKEMGLKGSQHMKINYNQEKLIRQLWSLINDAIK
ncbi:MAG TPA: glycosyltransferase [Saprospiraceae bacterium]|nr:glycosyltransferase [Saprospiraceae bacterium]